jgi:leucyl aminopeptidase (aminopeptidase T)
MPARSAIIQLPAMVKTELDRRLLKNGFSDYEALAAWLSEQGFEIGKSSVHRYGQGLERKLSAIKASTSAAAAIADAAPDDADLRSAAVISLIQTEVFDVLVTLQEADDADPAERLKLMSRAAKSIAELSRASVNQKKWQVEVRDKINAAADAVEAIAKKGGLSKAALDTIRRDILGIAA